MDSEEVIEGLEDSRFVLSLLGHFAEGSTFRIVPQAREVLWVTDGQASAIVPPLAS